MAAVPAVLALVGNLATSTVTIKAPWLIAAVWTVTGLLLVAAILAEVARHRSDLPALVTAASLDTAAGQLAEAVRAQWVREERHRKIADPVALPVSWRSVGDYFDDWANIRHSPTGGPPAGPLPLAGTLENIAAVYQRIPSGRLVILGEGGAGKTVLAARLVLDLLAARPAGGRVPVLVSVGSWDPASSGLLDWLATQLERDHSALAAPAGGQSLAAALLAGGRILPILDGFDELSTGLHTPALAQLNTVADLPMILTSRPGRYRAAVDGADVLTAAAGIELDPLTLADLASYLPRTTRRRALDAQTGLWDPVLARLRGNPDGPAEAALLTVLSTPLMVYLARTIYSDTPGHDPCELLDTHRFPDAGAIEEHLLGAYIPAVYQHPSPTGQQRHWNPERAQHWLTYLARHLGTRDLAWWQLRDTIPRTTRTLTFGLAFGLAFVFAFVLAVVLPRGLPARLGLVFAFVFAVVLLIGLPAGLSRIGPPPAQTHLRLRGRGRQLRRRAGALGLPVGLAVWFVVGVELTVTFGGVIGFWVGLAVGLAVGGVAWLIVGLAAPIDMTGTPGGGVSLATDRNNTILRVGAFGLVFGIPVGFWIGIAAGLGAGLAVGIPFGLAFGLAIGIVGAWGQWLVFIRVWLPLTGHLPWRVYGFLTDAYERGVLRQAGAVYQFRHARLQDHLTNTRGAVDPLRPLDPEPT